MCFSGLFELLWKGLIITMLTPKTFEFLFQNRMANSREWFQQHKSDYQALVLQPLTELASAIAPSITAIDSQIVTEPRVDKTISRIYRDTRFSKDKSLYREDMWLSYRRDKKSFPNYPEFFFVMTPDEYFYGCGYYAATKEAMDSVRSLILKNDPVFVKALRAYEEQDGFFIDGDAYKKSRYPDQPENIRTWLDRKSICFMRKSSDYSLLFSEHIADEVADTYRRMEPLYRFFIHAESMVQREKGVYTASAL